MWDRGAGDPVHRIFPSDLAIASNYGILAFISRMQKKVAEKREKQKSGNKVTLRATTTSLKPVYEFPILHLGLSKIRTSSPRGTFN